MLWIGLLGAVEVRELFEQCCEGSCNALWSRLLVEA